MENGVNCHGKVMEFYQIFVGTLCHAFFTLASLTKCQSQRLLPLCVRELFGTGNTGINFDKYEDIPVDSSGEDVPTHIDNVRLILSLTLLSCQNHKLFNLMVFRYLKLLILTSFSHVFNTG